MTVYEARGESYILVIGPVIIAAMHAYGYDYCICRERKDCSEGQPGPCLSVTALLSPFMRVIALFVLSDVHHTFHKLSCSESAFSSQGPILSELLCLCIHNQYLISILHGSYKLLETTEGSCGVVSFPTRHRGYTARGGPPWGQRSLEERGRTNQTGPSILTLRDFSLSFK